MSTVARLTAAELDAGQALTETAALELFWSNPEAVLDLIYGPSRRIEGTCPAHDHDEDGGEGHYRPILTRTWGRYFSAASSRLGIPIGPPRVGASYEITRTQGASDYSNAKQLDSCGIIIPGGCTALRVDLVEYHETANRTVTLWVCLRSLGSVNYKLGLGADDLIVSLEWNTAGATAMGAHSVSISDLTSLGDTGRDRLVEVSLWLGCDLDTTTEHNLLEWSVVPTGWATVRASQAEDRILPALAPRELRAGLGEISPTLLAKVKEIYNGLNLGLWGSTPGLFPQTHQPDTRRRYRETISGIHQHQGIVCYDGVSAYYGDGACLTNAQSFAFVSDLLHDTPLVVATPPVMDQSGFHARMRYGALLHSDATLATNWRIFGFRRSIEAGCGELRIMICAAPYQATTYRTDHAPRKTLLVSVEITPVGGGTDIALRHYCGPYAEITDDADDDAGFCEVAFLDDPAYLPAADLVDTGRGAFSRDSQITETDLSALGLTQFPVRVSQEIRVDLTSIVIRPADAYRATQDYDIRLRFKAPLNDGTANVDDYASLLWLVCWTPAGY